MTYQQSLTSSLSEIDQLLLNGGGGGGGAPSPRAPKAKAPAAAPAAEGKDSMAGGLGGKSKGELERLMKRLENVERGDKKMRAAVDGLQEDFGVWAEHMKRHAVSFACAFLPPPSHPLRPSREPGGYEGRGKKRTAGPGLKSRTNENLFWNL